MQHWTEMYQHLCRIKHKTKTTSLELKVFFRSNFTWFVQQQLIQRIPIDPLHTTVLFVYTLKTTGGIIEKENSGMKVVTFFFIRTLNGKVRYINCFNSYKEIV